MQLNEDKRLANIQRDRLVNWLNLILDYCLHKLKNIIKDYLFYVFGHKYRLLLYYQASRIRLGTLK